MHTDEQYYGVDLAHHLQENVIQSKLSDGGLFQIIFVNNNAHL